MNHNLTIFSDRMWIVRFLKLIFKRVEVDRGLFVGVDGAYVFYPSMPAQYVLETVVGFTSAHTMEVEALLLLKNFPSVSE